MKLPEILRPPNLLPKEWWSLWNPGSTHIKVYFRKYVHRALVFYYFISKLTVA